MRFGDPIPTTGVSGRDARADLEGQVRSAIERLLPSQEPRLPRRRPLAFLTDLLNGADDVARRSGGPAR